MTKPASLRAFRIARGKKGGQKLGLDLDRIDPSYNHNQREAENLETLRYLREELNRAEAEGRHSRSKKIRRYINQELEVGLYIRNSWCYGCNNVRHNCQCKRS